MALCCDFRYNSKKFDFFKLFEKLILQGEFSELYNLSRRRKILLNGQSTQKS